MTQDHYELLYIVSIKHIEDELQRVMEKVAKFIKDGSGEITLDNVLGQHRLAYPIKHITQGTYVVVEFNMAPAAVKKLDDQLKLSGEILRHFIVIKKVKTAAEIEREKTIKEKLRKDKEQELAAVEKQDKLGVKRAAEQPIVGVDIKTENKDDKSKTALEDLDKKLDEILKEDVV